MADYSTIRTQFVRDRLRATRWEDREYVQLLMGIERVICQGGPRNDAARLMFERLVRRYPVEHGAILTELRRGEVTTDSNFRLLCEAQQIVWHREEQSGSDTDVRAQKNQVDRLMRDRNEWLLHGGLD